MTKYLDYEQAAPTAAATPFESPFDRLTVLSNVEGVSCPTRTPSNRGFVGSALAALDAACRTDHGLA
jgi:hypothetical protein